MPRPFDGDDQPAAHETSENVAPESGSGPPEAGKLRLLSAMDILRDLSEEEVAALMDRSPMRTVRKGARIYGPDGPEVLFLLKSGQVEIYHESPDGRRLILAIVGEYTFFGEMSLIDLQLVGTHAVAREDSVICLLSRHDVVALMLEHPAVAVRLVEALARRLQESRVSLQEMAFNDLTGRVASLLLQLAGEGSNVVAGYSHQELASMVGCLRESFTVVLDRFKSSGAVTTGRRRILIADRSQLSRIIELRS